MHATTKRLILLTLYWFLIPCDQVIGAKQNDLSTSIAQFENLYRSSDRYRSLKASLDANDQSIRTFTNHDPFSVNVESSNTQSRPPFEQSESLKTSTYSSAATLNFEDRSSLNYSVSMSSIYGITENTFDQTFTGFEPVAKRIQKTHQVSSRLSYDVLNGGSQSSAHLTDLAATASAKANKLQLFLQIRDDEVSFVQELLNLQALRCKIKDLESVKSTVDRTIEIGRKKLSAKLISELDTIRFDNLRSSVQKRELQYKSLMDQSLNRLYTYGNPVRTELEKPVFFKDLCFVPIDDLKKLLVEAKKQLSAINKSKSLSERAAQERLSAANYAVSLERKNTNPGLRPYLEGVWSPEVDQSVETGNISIGVTFNWRIGGGRSTSREAESKLSAASSEITAELEKNNKAQRVIFLRNNLQTLLNSIAISQQSIDGVQKLVSANSKRLDLGLVDSFEMSSSLLSLIDSKSDLLDSHFNFVRSTYEIGKWHQVIRKASH